MIRRRSGSWPSSCTAIVGAVVLGCAVRGAWARETPATPAAPNAVRPTLDAATARATSDRCLAWLVANQRESGAWGESTPGSLTEVHFAVETHYCWQVAASCLAVMALLEAPAAEARDAALVKGLTWLATTRLPRRGSHWDSDHLWPALYGVVASVAAFENPRLAERADLREKIAGRAREWVALLVANQAPLGGWAYYDDPPWTSRTKWATSFCTALVLPALADAKRLGWLEDQRVITRAIRYLERCRLPNGAYQYSLDPIPWFTGGEDINQVKGSLGRIQVGNWALHTLGRPIIDAAALREGLTAFFDHHRFLDTARMRPIPHEGHYFNAGYFYNFGHYYAALAIERLPDDEREAWHARLRPHVVKTIRADGSTSDFLHSSYMLVGATAYSALTLEAGLR